MRYTQKLMLNITIISFLLSGCNQHISTFDSSAAFVSPSPSSKQTPQEENPTEDVQNLREMQLVMLFQGLLRMDRYSSLAITAKQAVVMLPYVRKSMDEGSINEFERKQVIDGLTIEQKTFLDEQSKQTNKRMKERMDKLGDELSPQEREKRVVAFIKKRKSEHPVETGMTDNANGVNLPFDARGMGISVEQQLMELLESKH